MAASDCIAEIKEAAGRLLTDDDVTAIVEELERRRLSRRGKASLESIEEQMFRDAEELASEIDIAARIEKRNRLINLKRQAERDGIIARFDDPGEALRALNVGTNSPVMGGRMSVDARNKAIEAELLGGFIADLRRENLIEVFNSEQKADEIARELWEIRSDGTGRPGITGDRDAQKIAQIISKYQEASRLRMNRAGAAIGKLDGYITKQSHDPVRIRRAGFEAWYKEIVGLLDHERTFQGEDPVKFLQGVYDGLTTGVHLKATGEQSDRMYAFRGPGNLAKRASAERVLHFQSADAWTRYNRDFGTGTFNESVLQGFRHAARTSAVMEVWGTNPEVAWQNTVRDLQAKHRGDPKKMAGIEPGSMKMQLREWEFREVAGMTNIAASRYFASFGSGVRATQSMAKLGGAVISSVTDVAFQAGEIRFQGESLLSGYSNALQNLVRGRGRGEQREIADLLGVGIEGMIGSMAARFSASDGVPGVAGKLMHRFFKLNGLSWWTDAHKTGVGLMMARKLAMERRLGWAELSEDRRRVLSLYGIDDARWDLIRQSAVRNADGAEFIVPQGIRDLPDDVLLKHLQEQGRLSLAGGDDRPRKVVEWEDWFAGSKVVDEKGDPLTVYHGTVFDIREFDERMLGSTTKAESAQGGFFFISDPRTASEYAEVFSGREFRQTELKVMEAERRAQETGAQADIEEHQRLLRELEELDAAERQRSDREAASGANVIPAHLSLKNPLVVDFAERQGYDEGAFTRAIAEAKEKGHDGAVLKNAQDDPVHSGRKADIYVAFRPDQIRTAFQRPPEAAAARRSDGADLRERRMIDRLKDDLTAQLGAYYTDRVDFAVLTPGARERAILKMGTQPGTVEGEVLRFIMQFKAFPTTVMTKAFSREIRGRGHADVPGLINFFVASTVLGYVAQSAKEMVKGRNPRDPLSPETWVAAFVQGGGAGIYGDFLFGTKSRFGAGPLDTLMGPTFGTVNDLAGLLEKVREGDDPSAAALRTVISNTPFANLFYLRTAMDYLFLYRIQEAMNPGFLRRFERRVERDNDQTFWLRPSEAVQ